ncbi:MAG: DUF1998 domain-containing protein [Deltaproteobacteria bacterium]|nr:DUF1998 domain-containing protein [Deltaproteobacteria bacterium]
MAAFTSKQKKKGQKPPEGKIRQSQVVTTFGPGAMVDLVERAVLIGGLDFWRYDKNKEKPIIDEPRLRDALAEKLKELDLGELRESEAFRAPPVGDDKEPSYFSGIQVAEFPTWFVCQGCRSLNPASNLERKRERWVHACKRNVLSECVPARFVASCERGHLEEFPWRYFVHANHKPGDCGAPDLYLLEGASGDFSEIVVQCACGATRKLSDALVDKSLPMCKGHRPWLGVEGVEESGCDLPLKLLVRTASYAYFAQTVSALSIPDPTRELLDTLRGKEVWNIVEHATQETLSTFRQLPQVGKPLQKYSDQQVLDGVKIIRHGESGRREHLRTAEYKQFMAQPEEVMGELPKREDEFFARRLVLREGELPDGIGCIVLAKKLREVRAQLGFSRFGSVSPNLQGEYEESKKRICRLGLNTDWLPASEIYGEGVLFCLDEVSVAAWEKRDAVEERTKELLDGFIKEFGEQGPAFPGARFYLLHSLAHLLISAISLECGYAASAIRERIYCAPSNDDPPMAAFLLSTGTSGSEGTLGGLVEQGRAMRHHLQRAYDLGTLCSNDPVCAAHNPADQAERFLEGAACHGCLFIAESACERFNRYLDRALVVPAIGRDRTLAFFGERP